MFLHEASHEETVFNGLLGNPNATQTTYHHHGILVNGQQLICNDSQIANCVKQCARVFLPIDQKACVTAVEARFAPYSKCFSGTMTVIVKGKSRPVTLSELRVGQEVLDVNMQYVRVVGWLHRDENLVTDFIEVLHILGSVCATPDHLLYCCDKSDYFPAKEVDALESVFIDGTMIRSDVISRRRVCHRGIFAPLTTSGTLLVNGIHASCYASPAELPFRISQSAGHLALAPYRIMSQSLLPELDSYCKSLYYMFAK